MPDRTGTGQGNEPVRGLGLPEQIENGPIKVAIADSHALFRDGLRTLIGESEGIHVVAESGSATSMLHKLTVCRADILMIATPLEASDGPEIFATLRQSFPQMKVIVLSGSNDNEEYLRNVRSGAQGIIQKSASGSLLIKAIRKVHEGEYWLDRTATAGLIRQLSEEPRLNPATMQMRGSEGRVPALSRREREIVALVVKGYRNKELAEKLAITEQTVKNHLHNIFDKLGVSDRLELALYAIQNNWHEPS